MKALIDLKVIAGSVNGDFDSNLSHLKTVGVIAHETLGHRRNRPGGSLCIASRPTAAATDIGTAPGGIDPVDAITPTTVSHAEPAVINPPSTGGSAATADATAGPGGAGSTRPAVSVCTQDADNKSEGASVNATGTQSAYARAATDGSVSTSTMATPQFKVIPAAVAVPSS